MNEQGKILDQTILVNLRQALGDRMPHILEVYMQEVPRSLTEMRAANDKQDYEAVKIIAHGLKSSSANVGAMQVSQLAASLELKLKQQQVDNLAVDIDKLAQAFDQVRPMFGEYM